MSIYYYFLNKSKNIYSESFLGEFNRLVNFHKYDECKKLEWFLHVIEENKWDVKDEIVAIPDCKYAESYIYKSDMDDFYKYGKITNNTQTYTHIYKSGQQVEQFNKCLPPSKNYYY